LVGHIQINVNIGIFLAKTGQQPDCKILNRTGYGNQQPPAIRPLDFIKDRIRLSQLGGNIPTQPVHFFSRLSQIDFTAQTFKQSQAGNIFKLLNLHGYRRLRQKKLLSRTGKTQMPRHHFKNLQLPDCYIHKTLLKPYELSQIL
jgi:hypothetical protein